MKFHFYTKQGSPYSFEYYIDICSDEEFMSKLNSEELLTILNSEDMLDLFRDADWVDLKDMIGTSFDMTTDGVFDWDDKTGEYYDHYDLMLHHLTCDLELDSGRIIDSYVCSLSDGWEFANGVFSIYINNFYCGNGEPEGAQLALNIVDNFIRSNQWNIGFYDESNILITDIVSWSKCNQLDINVITPIVWFGNPDCVHECWSITPKTTDLFVKEFWCDYYEGALPHICNADNGLGIYYSVWEYGLEYDDSIFNDIKCSCPVDLNLANVDRANALYNLIVSIYNENVGVSFHAVKNNLYLQDVAECNIIVKNDALSYLHIKPYRIKLSDLNELDKARVEDILLEDISYRNSFYYLKDKVIENCSLESCNKIWERTNKSLAQLQELFNCSLLCYIEKESKLLTTIPYSVDLRSYIPMSEINDIVFIKSVINFLKRGTWHAGFFKASCLPIIHDEYARIIQQEGVYPVVWFNDSEEIHPKLGIWSAHSQYTISGVWESASSFCSRVYGNIDVHNNFRNSGHPLYCELEKAFEEVKARCPIKIKGGKDPVDFSELEMYVRDSQL